MPDHSSQGAESHYRVLRVACCVLHATSGGRTTSKGKLLIWFCESTEPSQRHVSTLKKKKKKKMKRLDPDFFAFDSCLGDLSTDKNVAFALLVVS